MSDSEFKALKAQYDREGFIVLRDYLSEAEVSELRDRAVPLANAILKKQDNDGRYRNLLKSLNRHDDWFDNQLNNGKHLPLVRYLVGDDVFQNIGRSHDQPPTHHNLPC